MYCPACGQRWRVVSAGKGKTGVRLRQTIVKKENEIKNRLQRQDQLIVKLREEIQRLREQKSS